MVHGDYIAMVSDVDMFWTCMELHFTMIHKRGFIDTPSHTLIFLVYFLLS